MKDPKVINDTIFIKAIKNSNITMNAQQLSAMYYQYNSIYLYFNTISGGGPAPPMPDDDAFAMVSKLGTDKIVGIEGGLESNMDFQIVEMYV